MYEIAQRRSLLIIVAKRKCWPAMLSTALELERKRWMEGGLPVLPCELYRPLPVHKNVLYSDEEYICIHKYIHI